MEEIRSSPARRLSQILDPIARLTSELGSSSSAPCSPRLGSRHHEACCSSSGPSSLGAPHQAESPRLMPKRGRQGPTPPPRPRNNNSPLPYRDSPYVNVSNLVFQKDKSFAETAKSAGYVELKDNSGSSGSINAAPSASKAKSSPYNFTSESSGHVEYVDGRSYVGQSAMDFGPTCYEDKAHDIQNSQQGFGRVRSPFEPGTSQASGRSPFERSYSMTGRQQPESQSRLFPVDMGPASLPPVVVPQEVVKEPKGVYGSSKSFDGYSSTVEELNWQERCLELQLELHRSRNQASRVRDMLREKVSESLSL